MKSSAVELAGSLRDAAPRRSDVSAVRRVCRLRTVEYFAFGNGTKVINGC
ncbi:MAG: hypothetical protein RIT81_16820 [Deltaproteobacteria bacterium]